jgi:prephenate dehydrogenase
MGRNAILNPPKVGIVGGTGRMGSWFADIMQPYSSEVFRVGRTTDLTPSEMARRCEVVVISVPVAQTIHMIREIGPLVSEKGLLMDLTSIKTKPVEAMLRYSRAEVVGTHPLFGPERPSDSGLRMVLCRGRGRVWCNWLSTVLRDAGLKVMVLSPERHDRLMGLVQGVNHLSTITLGLCIIRSGLMFDELLNASTQTFANRIDRIRAMTGQPAELFGSLLMDNPPAGEFMDHFLEAMEELLAIIKKKDRASFEKIFESLKAFFCSEETDSHNVNDAG